MDIRELTGSVVALVTPFKADGSVDFDALARLVDFHLQSGTDAILTLGTTGESATMTDEEDNSVVDAVVKQVAGRIPVIAGSGSNCTAAMLDKSLTYQGLGADGLLLITPYYNKCTQKGLIAHYKAIAESINIPIVLYDVPSRTGVGIQIPTYVELAKIPNIVAVKEANGDLSKILRLRAACGDSLDVYSGNDDQIVPILSLGGKGVISVLSNVAPKETHDMCQLYFDGKAEEAGKMQIAYADLIDALFCEVNPIPVKVAMRKLGYAAGPLRMPLSEMEPEHEKQLETALRHGLIK